MAKFVRAREAEPHLFRLLDAVAAGAEVLITGHAKPSARLVALRTGSARAFGIDRSRLAIPEDFDAPLDVDVLEALRT